MEICKRDGLHRSTMWWNEQTAEVKGWITLQNAINKEQLKNFCVTFILGQTCLSNCNLRLSEF
jgi:hypothetical protein